MLGNGFQRLSTLLLVAAICTALAWAYAHRERIAWQWDCYRVGMAGSYAEARQVLADFEGETAPQEKLTTLVQKFGNGNQRFDLYLATYLSDPQCSPRLRQAFSLELAWRPQQLARWAHFWCYTGLEQPQERVQSLLEHLTVLSTEETPRSLSWSDVLELQAAFALTGHERLAMRLKPVNWHHRFEHWLATDGAASLRIAPAPQPFPDWQGPLPERSVRAAAR